MRTVIITIKPRHLNDILAGKKSLELRKTFPKIEPPFNVECCESGSGGQIKGRFECYGKIGIWKNDYESERFARMACVTEKELDAYIGGNDFIYGWRVDEVIDYTNANNYRIKYVSDYGVDRPPQSWCYAKRVVK